MAVFTSSQDPAASIAENASDYGSDIDIDDATVTDLFAQLESQPLQHVVLESIEEEDANVRDGARVDRVHLRLSQLRQNVDDPMFTLLVRERQLRAPSVEVEYDESNRTAFSPTREVDDSTNPPPSQLALDEPDARSPLQRFRTRPKKPLSVTDLVSPAWCEQQYEYSLRKYGRVRKTPAMKQGSSVHKELEEEVHVQVPVATVTREDRFGLRIWNTISGLRALAETGLTRELEVWGVVEGEVVNGVIDEVTATCPDEGMEARLKEGKEGKKADEMLPADQTTLEQFLSGGNSATLESNPAFLRPRREAGRKTFYVVDIKTRQSRTLPAQGSQTRPTYMQLMLYRRLLSSLASNEVDSQIVFDRYNLDAHATFSDKFVADIANLDPAIHTPSFSAADAPNSDPDTLTELLAHNTLSALWALLIAEFSRTITINISHSAISPLLTAEYRIARARADTEEQAGAVLGRRSFAYDAKVLDAYVKDEMQWWKGVRETKGVEVEEAYKCRICEFAEACTWRATRVEEGIRKARLRQEERRRSEV